MISRSNLNFESVVNIELWGLLIIFWFWINYPALSFLKSLWINLMSFWTLLITDSYQSYFRECILIPFFRFMIWLFRSTKWSALNIDRCPRTCPVLGRSSDILKWSYFDENWIYIFQKRFVFQNDLDNISQLFQNILYSLYQK